jgi:hypothetical protein
VTVESLPCAVCGFSVPLDEDHTRVQVDKKRMRDRDDRDDYVIHDSCARSVFEGWTSP